MASKVARLLSGTELAFSIRESIRLETAVLPRHPCLAVVTVGERIDSDVFVRNKKRAADECGIDMHVRRLADTVTEERLIRTVRELNDDFGVDGIIVQLPLPTHIDTHKAIMSIDPNKDVDGLHPLNAGRLFVRDTPEGSTTRCSVHERDFHEAMYFIPCTAMAVRSILNHNQIKVENKRVVVINRSMVVGVPTAAVLLRENATVTITHRLDKQLKELTRTADIIVSASGKPKFLTADFIKPDAVIIDVAINELPAAPPPPPLEEEGDPFTVGSAFHSSIEEANRPHHEDALEAIMKEAKISASNKRRICGDVDMESVMEVASAITPVPGGVGPMTVASLMQNTLKAYRRRIGLEPSSNEGVFGASLDEESNVENSFAVV